MAVPVHDTSLRGPAFPPGLKAADAGTPIEAACRIVILEDQFEEAQRINEELRAQGREPQSKTSA